MTGRSLLRALGLFWGVVILLLGAGGAWLHSLGPLPPGETPVAEAPAPPPPPPPRPAAPEPSAQQAAPAPTPPSAPEPPPLRPSATARPGVEPTIALPDPALLQPSRHGPLPAVAPDGRTSIRVYGRPFDAAANVPRVGVIVGGIGLFALHGEEAIRRLPGGVTLAFSPYAARPEPLMERARARGMEVLIGLPLEPAGFPVSADPGDRALLTGLTRMENLDRLEWSLSRIQGYVGAIGALGPMRGERFAANAELLTELQTVLRQRGLLYIDARPGGPQPVRAFGRSVDLVLDEPSATRGEVERRLGELEALARRNGSALGMVGDPSPSVIAGILAWSTGLEERGVALAPVSALIRRPAAEAAQR
jgi:hypothetical protein